jgi:hypothetical protein
VNSIVMWLQVQQITAMALTLNEQCDVVGVSFLNHTSGPLLRAGTASLFFAHYRPTELKRKVWATSALTQSCCNRIALDHY